MRSDNSLFKSKRGLTVGLVGVGKIEERSMISSKILGAMPPSLAGVNPKADGEKRLQLPPISEKGVRFVGVFLNQKSPGVPVCKA
jgi:hypothetical protein